MFPLEITWTPELVIALSAAVASPIITLVSMIFKHQLDMAAYRKMPYDVQHSISPQITHVQETIENGISAVAKNTNQKVTELRDEMLQSKWKDGC